MKPPKSTLIQSNSRQAGLVSLCWLSHRSGCSPPAQLPTGKINSHALPLNSFISHLYPWKLQGWNLANICDKEQNNKMCCVKIFY